MKGFLFFSFTLLICSSTCIFSQPGPPIPYEEIISPVNIGLVENPDNDALRLERINLKLSSEFVYPIFRKVDFFQSDSSNMIHEEMEFGYTSSVLADLAYLYEHIY